MAITNNIIATLNFIALLCSIPIITTGVWLASKQDNECIRLIRWPVILLGVLILIVALTGFAGAFWNQQGLLALHLCFMLILITLLLVLVVFAFVVTSPNGAYSLEGTGYSFKEYRLQGYSAWLRDHVTDSNHWAQIRTCLSSSEVCKSLGQRFLTPQQLFTANLSPLQSGCCKPPIICGFSYVNPTLWINPTNQAADADCYLWSNDQTQLCYGCNSCKAGLLGNLRNEWRKANVIMIVALVVLICIYIIACSACRNAQTEELFHGYK